MYSHIRKLILNNEYIFIVTYRIQLSKIGGAKMENFLPKKHEKEVISMRIPSETLNQIDDKAAAIGISRNEFINQCIAFALANMKNKENR